MVMKLISACLTVCCRSWRQRQHRLKARRGLGGDLDRLARLFEADGGAEAYKELFELLIMLELMLMEVAVAFLKTRGWKWVGRG